MPFQAPGSGQGNVAEFMMSGLPYVTSSTVASGAVYAIQFPYMTKDFTIKNAGDAILSVGFTLSGTLGSNRFTLPPSASFSGDLRIRTLYVAGFNGTATYEVVAGLTLIGTRGFPILTGSSPIATDITASAYDPYMSYPGLG